MGTDYRIIIYACGLLISVPFLLLTIVAYCITPRLKDAHGKALCRYCGCLAVAFTTLAIAQLASEYMRDEVCISIGKKFLHLTYTSKFFHFPIFHFLRACDTWASYHISNYVSPAFRPQL